MPWSLYVVGSLRLEVGATRLKPERRTMAVLTYLTLEGPTARSRLAGLLWPGVEERRARNNLVQALRRLKKVTNTNLVTGDDMLKLSEVLKVDIAALTVLAFQSKYEDLLKFAGELLPYDYDDLPEFSDWLLLERDKLLKLRREALTSLIAHYEKENDYPSALGHAQSLLQLDLIAEESYCLLMRLQYLAGNRAEAMKTFERCKSVLQKELGVEPSLETHKLAAEINFSALELTPTKPQKTVIPLSVLRPPVLVGREDEWEQLEAAWHAGQFIFIHGEPGVGKTRLMLDFMASKGDILLVDARPTDATVMYGTYARIFARHLTSHPGIKLDPWVRRELSRIVPHLLDEEPAPMQSEADKLRFFEAVAWYLKEIRKAGSVAVVMDDLQFIDAGSFEAGSFLFNLMEPMASLGNLRSVNSYRSDELPPDTEASINKMVAAGLAVKIEVRPLAQEDVRHMLDHLDLCTPLTHAETLSRYTGGNPMFILETLKSLLASGQEDWLQPFPISGKVTAVIQKRLQRLQPFALKLARVAAVAGTDFTVPLAETILKLDALELTESFAELERLQVLQGTAFAHDLIYEATLSGIPAPIKTLLHRRVAGWLETSNANPARIAFHLLAAGESLGAVPFLGNAALQAAAQYQLRKVVNYATQAAHILEGAGKREGAWEFWEQVREVLQELNLGDELEVVIKGLHRTASTLKQRAQSLNAECSMWIERDNAIEAERMAAQALYASQESGDHYAIGHAHNNLGTLYWMQGDTSKAADHMVIFSEYAQLNLQKSIDLGRPEVEINKAKREVAKGLTNYAVMLDGFGCYDESEVQNKKAIEIYREVRDVPTLANVLLNLSLTLLNQGRGHEALECVIEAKQQQALLAENTLGSINTTSKLSNVYLKLDQYTQALDYAHQAREAAEGSQNVHLFSNFVRLGKLYRILGSGKQARYYFKAAQVLPQVHITFEVPLLREFASFLLEQGEEASEMVNQALNALTQGEHLWAWYKTHLELIAHFNSDERMRMVNETLKKPGLQTMKGLHILALTRGAQTQLEVGKAKKALDFSQQAIALLKHYDPDLQRAEVLLTHYQTLKANKDIASTAWLEQTLAWLTDVANNQVPAEYRESFLTKNPVNKAILDEATRVGISLSVP